MVSRLERRIVALALWARSPRRRIAALALLGLVAAAHASLTIHTLQHGTVAKDATCALCTAAHQPAAPGSTIQVLKAAPSPVEPPRFTRSLPVALHFESPYRSRAPPAVRLPI